jgi:hypothetical protein
MSSLESCVDTAMDTLLMTSVVCSRDYEDDTDTSSSHTMHTDRTSSTSSSSSILSTSSSTTTSCSSSTSKYEEEQEEEQEEAAASFDIFIAVDDEPEPSKVKQKKYTAFSPFALFRIQYLIVHTAIMLADGLQGETETLLFILLKNYILNLTFN